MDGPTSPNRPPPRARSSCRLEDQKRGCSNPSGPHLNQRDSPAVPWPLSPLHHRLLPQGLCTCHFCLQPSSLSHPCGLLTLSGLCLGVTFLREDTADRLATNSGASAPPPLPAPAASTASAVWRAPRGPPCTRHSQHSGQHVAKSRQEDRSGLMCQLRESLASFSLPRHGRVCWPSATAWLPAPPGMWACAAQPHGLCRRRRARCVEAGGQLWVDPSEPHGLPLQAPRLPRVETR